MAERRMMVAAFTERELADEFVAEFRAKGGPEVTLVSGPPPATWIVEAAASDIERARQIRVEIAGA